MTCKHTHIVTYIDVETNQPTSLWACAECGRRFEPLTDTDDTALLRLALELLEDSIDTVRHEYESDWRHGLPTRAKQIAGMKEEVDKHEAAIAILRERLGEKA